jgi:Tfp pilus assembly protein FimT
VEISNIGTFMGIFVKKNIQAGFSLVESIAIMAIMIVLLSIGLPQLTKYTQNNKLKDAARSLQGDIQKVKQRAIAENSVPNAVAYTISFDTGNNSYTINTPNTIGASQSETKKLSSFGNITLISTGNINNNTITLLSRGVTDTTINKDTITLSNIVLSKAYIQTTSMGKVNVSYSIK